MVNVTAATSFLGARAEGMWRAGDTRRVSAHRANELIEEGLAIEARDQSEEAVTPKPDALAQVGFAIGATAAEPVDANLPAVADALGAKVADELPPVTLASMKQDKKKGATKEDKAEGLNKDEK